MLERQPHRKRCRHFDEPGDFHELTFSCYQRLPLLTNDVWRQMLGVSVDRAVERHGYRLAAFVFMPEHVHLLVYPNVEASPIEGLLKAIKRPYSYRIKGLLVASRSPLLEKLTVRQRPGVTTFRYWQEGPGYDRNLTSPGTVQASLDYIHNNPVARGLCRAAVDWRWSSARHFAAEGPVADPGVPTVHGLPPEFFDGRG